MRNRFLNRAVCLSAIALIFLIDQGTKAWAKHTLLWGNAWSFQWGHVGIQARLAYNTGAAFGFLHQAGGWQNGVFVLIAGVVLLIVCIHLWCYPHTPVLQKMGLVCLAGGTLGNVWDRVNNGYVVDFIDFFISSWHWPTFNVADTAICLSAFIFIVIGRKIFSEE